MKVFVQFSGGKDSQACLIQACDSYGSQNVTAIFCDTCWEHILTYEHIQSVVKTLGVKLIVLKAKWNDGFIGLCKQMKWFPDSKHRMCTVKLKIYPTIDFILDQNEDLLIIQGIRAAESRQRSKMACSGDYFQEYKNGDGSNTKRGLYRKTDVLNWCKVHRATVERPFFGSSSQDVINYILDHNQVPNPLYKKGYSRVGCFPCIFSKLSELKLFAKEAKYISRLEELENEVISLRGIENGSPASFFPKGKIPARFCKKLANNIPTIRDIIEYVTRENAQLDLFDNDESTSCMSVYHGLCE